MKRNGRVHTLESNCTIWWKLPPHIRARIGSIFTVCLCQCQKSMMDDVWVWSSNIDYVLWSTMGTLRACQSKYTPINTHKELILIITWLTHLFKAALVFSSLALCQFRIYNPFVVSFIQLSLNGLIQKTFKFLKELCMSAYTYLYMWTEWGELLNVLLCFKCPVVIVVLYIYYSYM